MPSNDKFATQPGVSLPGHANFIRVLIHGLAYFSNKLPAFLADPGWEFRNYPPRWSLNLPANLYHLSRCDLVYTWGGRLTFGKFLSAARALRKRRLVMFWCGSDVLEARSDFEAARTEPWIAEKIHWAGAPWLAEEVRAMGLDCEFVPTTWVEVPSGLAPLPEKFTVLAYLPDVRRVQLYGIDQILQVAKALPRINFVIVGLQPGQQLSAPENVVLHNRLGFLEPFYRSATVVWRPTRHDGLSFMALEAMAHGRHVLWSYPFPHALHVRDADSARVELERMLELHEHGYLDSNRQGAEYIRLNFSPQKIKHEILSRWRRVIESPLCFPESAFSRVQ